MNDEKRLAQVSMEGKPDHLEVITKEMFVEAVENDLDGLLRAAGVEVKHITKNHNHNLSMATRLAQIWSNYVEKLTGFGVIRSIPDEDYIFLRDMNTGDFGYKHVNATWEQPEGTYPALQEAPPNSGGARYPGQQYL